MISNLPIYYSKQTKEIRYDKKILSNEGKPFSEYEYHYDVHWNPFCDSINDELLKKQLPVLIDSLNSFNPYLNWKEHLETNINKGNRYIPIASNICQADKWKLLNYPIFQRGKYRGGIIFEEAGKTLVYKIHGFPIINYIIDSRFKIDRRSGYYSEQIPYQLHGNSLIDIIYRKVHGYSTILNLFYKAYYYVFPSYGFSSSHQHIWYHSNYIKKLRNEPIAKKHESSTISMIFQNKLFELMESSILSHEQTATDSALYYAAIIDIQSAEIKALCTNLDAPSYRAASFDITALSKEKGLLDNESSTYSTFHYLLRMLDRNGSNEVNLIRLSEIWNANLCYKYHSIPGIKESILFKEDESKVELKEHFNNLTDRYLGDHFSFNYNNNNVSLAVWPEYDPKYSIVLFSNLELPEIYRLDGVLNFKTLFYENDEKLRQIQKNYKGIITRWYIFLPTISIALILILVLYYKKSKQHKELQKRQQELIESEKGCR